MESTEEMVPVSSQCVHVSDIGDTTWSDILHRQEVCIMCMCDRISSTD